METDHAECNMQPKLPPRARLEPSLRVGCTGTGRGTFEEAVHKSSVLGQRVRLARPVIQEQGQAFCPRALLRYSRHAQGVAAGGHARCGSRRPHRRCEVEALNQVGDEGRECHKGEPLRHRALDVKFANSTSQANH